MNKARLLVLAFTLCVTQTLSAVIVTYSNKASFLAETGATSATGALPDLGLVGLGPQVIGSLTVQSASGNLYVGAAGVTGITDWTARLAGNDIAISGFEHLDVFGFGSGFSFGFDFVEPENDPNVNATFAESTFSVTLLSGVATVDSFSFSRDNDIAAFVGVWSDTAFDKVEIRETTGNIENEFFGEMYIGTRAIPGVPDSGSTAILLGAGLIGLITLRRRFRNS